MWDTWFDKNSYYSHGLLVPIISVLLIYQKKNALKNIKSRPSPEGMKIFIIGMIIHTLSSFLQIHFLSGFSILLVITGLVLHFYGADLLREIFFPISFLI